MLSSVLSKAYLRAKASLHFTTIMYTLIYTVNSYFRLGNSKTTNVRNAHLNKAIYGISNLRT